MSSRASTVWCAAGQAIALAMALPLVAPAAALAAEVGRISSEEVGRVTVQAWRRGPPERGDWVRQDGVGSTLDMRVHEYPFELRLDAAGGGDVELRARAEVREAGGPLSHGDWRWTAAAGALVREGDRFVLQQGLPEERLLRPAEGDGAIGVEIHLDGGAQLAVQPEGPVVVMLSPRAPQLDAALARLRDWWLAGWAPASFFSGSRRSLMPPGLGCAEGAWAVASGTSCAGPGSQNQEAGTPLGIVSAGNREHLVMGLGSGLGVPAEAALALGEGGERLVLDLFPLADRGPFLLRLDLGLLPADVLAALSAAERAAGPAGGLDPGPGGDGGGSPLLWLAVGALLAVALLGGWSMAKRRTTSADEIRAALPKDRRAKGIAGAAAETDRSPRPRTAVPGPDASGPPPRAQESAAVSLEQERVLAALREEIRGLRETLDDLQERLGAASNEVQGQELRLADVEGRIAQFAVLSGRVEDLSGRLLRVEQWRERMETAAARGEDVGLPASEDPAWIAATRAIGGLTSGAGELSRLAVDVAGLDPALRLLLWYADVLLGQRRVDVPEVASWFDASGPRPERQLLEASREQISTLRRGWIAAFARIAARQAGAAQERPLTREEKEALKRIVAEAHDQAALAREVVKRVVVPFLCEATYLVDAALVERLGAREVRDGRPLREVAMRALRAGAESEGLFAGDAGSADFHLEHLRRALLPRLRWTWVEIRPFADDQASAEARARQAGVPAEISVRPQEGLRDRAGAGIASLAGQRWVFRVPRPALVGPGGESLPLQCQILGA